MLAYKAFSSDLTARMGSGHFQFEPGKTYEEQECKCAHNGFHCTENPLGVLDYYNSMYDRYFIVEAAGDINQDGTGSRISCTRLTLKKEITRIQLAALGCEYMRKYPERETESSYVLKDRGRTIEEGDFIIVRGKHPQAAGVKGSYLFFVQEKKTSMEIAGIYAIEIDGEEYKEGTWYGLRGGAVCEKRN